MPYLNEGIILNSYGMTTDTSRAAETRTLPPMPRPRLLIRPDVLRQHRLKAVLSRQQLADLSGVSARRIEQLEIGDDPGIRPETARALASALGCPVNDLVEVVDGE